MMFDIRTGWNLDDEEIEAALGILEDRATFLVIHCLI